MNTTGLVKYAGAVAALAICSACSGGSALAPSSAAVNSAYIGRTLSLNGRLVTAARVNSPLPRYATILPDRLTGHRKFEYIINDYGSFAGIFDYPKSDQQIGTINDVGGQGCTNVLFGYGKKIFWIVAAFNQIEEFKVPDRPIKSLSVSDGSMPSSCAMDTNGDLAVGILDGPSTGDIDLYKNATGSGTLIPTPLAEEFFDGYDNKGNLFADGFTSSGSFGLVELPKGSNKAETITTSNAIKFPGSVQWDGKFMTVFDQDTNNLYQYTISGTKATLQGTVSFTTSSDCAQTWLVKGLVYCGDAGNNNGSVFKYPAGGSAIAVFTGNFDLPLGVTAAKR
jgi:hypothetical protein